MDQDTAWRLFTRALCEDEAAELVALDGDPRLRTRLLDMRAIIS